MKSWTLVVALALAAFCSALPVPEETTSAEEPSNVSRTLRVGIQNLGNSAIQILEGTGVAAEQALGTGARIVTGAAETAAEAAETGAKSAIRIANGVANSLSQGTKALVDTKTQLLKGLTGASPSALQADASSNSESVQRNERNSGYSSGGYGSSSPSYGPNTVAETPNNFLNVFSQAAANTVNFGTQLLNSLVGVAANILQGTVSTLLSLLNAKGQVVGAVVQSAPPVLASVTRTAGDVLAAKARIFGAVTQAAVQFGSQLARTFGDTFGQLLNGRQSSDGSSSSGSPLAQFAQLFSGRGSSGSSSGYGSSSGSSSGNLLSGAGNFAQTLISSKLNLLNGLISPFTGGRPVINFGNRGSSSSGSSSASSFSEPNFRISIASASTPGSISVSSPSDSSTAKSSGPRYPRFYINPEATPKTSPDSDLTAANLISSFKSGVFKGIVDQFNADLQSRISRLASRVSGSNIDPVKASSDNSASYSTAILPNAEKESSRFLPVARSDGDVLDGKPSEVFSKILPISFANNNYFNTNY